MAQIVKQVAGGNPVLQSIIADTAQTTYVEQRSAESSSMALVAEATKSGFGIPAGMDPSMLEGLDAASVGMLSPSNDPDPSELTGEAASWAAILDRV